MPYIHPDRRVALVSLYERYQSAGELNYILTQVALDYLGQKGLSYSTINDILGAFEGAKLEFYRRIAVDYEKAKITENGDVYPCLTPTLTV